MTLTQLTYVVALADHGHFGRAAEACFVSQPTLSGQIQKLEQDLGVLLFDRSAQPVRPTGQGAQFVAQARVVLAERDRLAVVLKGEGPIAGTLRVGIIPTLTTYLLPLTAPTLRDRYPGLELSVEELTTEHLMGRLAAGHLDAGLVATEEARPGLEAVPLFREAFVAYVADDHPLAAHDRLRPADLDDADLWLLAEGHCLRDQVMQLCQRAQPSPNHGVRFESGSLETLRHLVDRVGGLTLLPLLATHYLGPEPLRRIRYFEAPTPDREVRLVRPRASIKERLIDALAEVVQASVTPILKAGA